MRWRGCGQNPPVPKAINRVTYLHDTLLVDLAETLVARTGGEFVPKRRLRAELKTEGQRTLTRLLDGLPYLNDKKPIAIEHTNCVRHFLTLYQSTMA